MAKADPYEVEEYRSRWAGEAVERRFGVDLPRYSNVEVLIRGATKEAAEQAVQSGHLPGTEPKSLSGSPFDEFLGNSIRPIEDLYWSFSRRGGERDGYVWSHRPWLLQDVKANDLPNFQRADIEQAAGSYLQNPIKTATADRLMVDILVALEFAQYAETVIRAPHIPIIAPSVLKRNVLLEWFGGRLIAAIMSVLCYSLFAGLSAFGLFPASWLWGVGLILLGLFLLEAAWGTVMAPAAWIAARKAKSSVLDLVGHMSAVYAALASEGPISSQHVAGLVARGTEAGVVWPGPLHVLLEDISARGGRF